jgi:hypothetical protein
MLETRNSTFLNQHWYWSSSLHQTPLSLIENRHSRSVHTFSFRHSINLLHAFMDFRQPVHPDKCKQNFNVMKSWKIKLLTGLVISSVVLLAFSIRKGNVSRKKTAFVPKGCVFRTVMGEESSKDFSQYKTPEKVIASLDHGLDWLVHAQNANGGWGSGTHSRQEVMDPHAVTSDPATTAMAAMALLRSGSTLTQGTYIAQLKKGLEYLLQSVETSEPESNNITSLTGTQIQIKLGANIDVVLASQFLSNILTEIKDDQELQTRVKKAQAICVSKIQKAQSGNGSTQGSGWAGVLQSSFATNALEAAEAQGIDVDKKALDKAREFQKSNYNAKTGDVNTEMGAGVVLYAVTGSARASAKEARKVEADIQKGKDEGKLAQQAPATAQSLMDIGYSHEDAMKYATSYEVYQSAKVQAQRDDVMDGFGNNGGEEFLSYLQTGESMIINKDSTWQNWYDNISGRMLKIQNDDGSWNGHHCITSPVFCTATSLLILSVNNDVENLMKLGEDK